MSDTGTKGYVVTPEQLAMLGGGDERKGRTALTLMLADERERKPIVGPTAKPDKVRVAGPRDEAALLDLIMLDVRENALPIAAPSPERVMAHITACTRAPAGQALRGILPCIDGPDGKPIAAAALLPMQWWFANTWFMMEMFHFVHPDHRKSGHAADLLRFEAWLSDALTESFGYRVFLLAGVTATKRARPKLRLYARHMNPVGGFFLYPHFTEAAS